MLVDASALSEVSFVQEGKLIRAGVDYLALIKIFPSTKPGHKSLERAVLFIFGVLTSP